MSYNLERPYAEILLISRNTLVLRVVNKEIPGNKGERKEEKRRGSENCCSE